MSCVLNISGGMKVRVWGSGESPQEDGKVHGTQRPAAALKVLNCLRSCRECVWTEKGGGPRVPTFSRQQVRRTPPGDQEAVPVRQDENEEKAVSWTPGEVNCFTHADGLRSPEA